MKRLFFLILSLSLLVPDCNVLHAQENGQHIKSGLVIENTTIREKEVKKKGVYTKRGYQQTANIAFATDFGECIKFGAEYIGGYRFNNVFYLGAGFGISYNCGGRSDRSLLIDYDIIRNVLTMPLFLHLRTYIGRQHNLFLALSAGYEFGLIPAGLTACVAVFDSDYGFVITGHDYVDLGDHYEGSFFVEPMLGWSIPLHSKLCLDLQVGLKLHKITVYNEQLYGFYYKHRIETDLAVKIGLRF